MAGRAARRGAPGPARSGSAARPAHSPLTWLAALLSLYLLAPLAAFVLRLPGAHDLGFGTPGLWGALAVSVETATISTAIVALLGIPLAYRLAHSSGPLAAAVGVLTQLPLAMPPVMSGLVLIYVVGPYTSLGRLFDGRLTESLVGVVLAQSFVASPFLVTAARAAFATVDPALEELAATLGHRPLARFWRVSLPTAAGGIRAGLLLTWLRAFGEYGATVLLAYHPYSLPVFTYIQFSSTGIPTTQAPTALALGVAGGVVLLSRLPWGRAPERARVAGSGRADRQTGAQAPQSQAPVPVAFDLDLRVGSFHLAVAHRASSARLAILGPSGSGKSLTLRCLAGLVGPGAGSVSYGGSDVTYLPPEERRVGYVPQGQVLLPGLPVWRQLGFATDARPELAAWWLSTLGLEGLEARLPGQLSGGQRQRVSLAQALSRGPRLVLLDEPFSALDAPVRDELRRELRRLQRDTGLSTVLVTHDPEEAALLADEILVLAEGRLLQAGPHHEVYARPASPEVARLLGIQNLSRGVVGGPGQVVSAEVILPADTGGLASGTPVLWCVRPERVRVLPTDQIAEPAAAGELGGTAGPGPGRSDHPGVVVDRADLGDQTSLIVRLGAELELRARTTDPVRVEAGQSCLVTLETASLTVWPAAPEVGPEDVRFARSAGDIAIA